MATMAIYDRCCFVVLLSLLHCAQIHLECTVSSVVAIAILITHAVQRPHIHSHLFNSCSSQFKRRKDGRAVMPCMTLSSSQILVTDVTGCVSAVFNYSMSINNPKLCEFMQIMSELLFFYNFKQTYGIISTITLTIV